MHEEFDEALLRAALAAYGAADAAFEPISIGNINRTYFVDAEGAWVLQRLNPIFAAEIHFDIEAITAHLASKGVATPRLRRTQNQALWYTDREGHAWRMMNRIDGLCHSNAKSPALCHNAAALAAAFHAALCDLQHTFHSARLGVHDTERHLQNLRSSIAAHPDHVASHEAAVLAGEIIESVQPLLLLPALPERIVHGDMKLNNIIFAPDETALCFIDLDTLAHMPIAIELGDALRSWCNPGGENAADAQFDVALFAAALEGYASGRAPSIGNDELRLLPQTTQRITLELAARFCADVVNESYFGWDAQHYEHRWQHNLTRARSQLTLARSMAAAERESTQIANRLFG